jgi:predicted neuraminidase
MRDTDMKILASRFGLGYLVIIATLFFLPKQETQAQTCNYFAGTALGRQSINVDLCSISRASSNSVDFTYYLAKERIESQANCIKGTWTTFPEKVLQFPQSKATQEMLNVVCSYRFSSQVSNSSNTRVGDAFIFAPPSNIRSSPNSRILCSVGTRRTIKVYGSIGSWL